MFNLTIDEAHTFYVSQNGWLVHNGPSNKNVSTMEDALSQKAPKQVTPGVRTLEGFYKRDNGQIERWVAHYDEYGRLIGRTDFAGNKAAGIPDPHYHTYDWSNINEAGKETGSHLPGVYTPCKTK